MKHLLHRLSGAVVVLPAVCCSQRQTCYPSRELSRGANEWNHDSIRAFNGGVRWWANGEEVSGGTECSPATGYLCFESEGSLL